MRVLLDTNVWRYLIDYDAQDKLYKVCRQSNTRVVVAPSVVIETLRLSDPTLRKKIIEIQTRDCWGRLMPDAYLQCEDMKNEMVRTHPEWVRSPKDVSLFKNLRYDWIRTKGGFWEKTRTNTDAVSAQYQLKDASTLAEVRQQLKEIRESVLETGEKMVSDGSLRNLMGSWRTINDEYIELEAWRVYCEVVWKNLLSRENSVFQQWLGCDIDIQHLLTRGAWDFLNFWKLEVQAIAVPREWIRAAIYALQSERKVTDGNPTDSSIAVHLVDVDVFVSADKNFIAMTNQIQDEAPFETAHGFLIGAGNEGVDQLFHLISSRFIAKTEANTRH